MFGFRELDILLFTFCILSNASVERVFAEDEIDEIRPEENIGEHKSGWKTASEADDDQHTIQMEKLQDLLGNSDPQKFETEVNRIMKLIINSLYRNKEIFLRELISNASDALDKIRLLALTDRSIMDRLNELTIRIKADKENRALHITDTGIGMTRSDLVKNLGTIAKSGTSEFLAKMSEKENAGQLTDLIGQFGVGFYSAFLVSDRVVVTSKHNNDSQHIWESDSNSFRVVEDPRGNTLQRGTTISLFLKEEARDFLEPDTLEKLIKKYSQFLNFDIFLWKSKTEEVEEPIEEEKEEKSDKADDAKDPEADVEVEEAEDEKKPKTKKVSKTVWNWEKQNDAKPIWMRKPSEVDDAEYADFYKTLTNDAKGPLAHTHFVAEGEVTFKSLLYVPEVASGDVLKSYGSKKDGIKLYVRRVFIKDEFPDLLPNYLAFVRGIIDSDDLPLNVGREDLQQNKLFKVMSKKVIRKLIDTIGKLPTEEYNKFWKEYSTNIKLGVFEDSINRSRLAKLLRFFSSRSGDQQISLLEYVGRVRDGQEHIYFVAAANKEECERSPFTERLLKKGYEVLYLTEAIDEYAITSLPEFQSKKFQNVAKEGLTLKDDEEKFEAVQKQFKPLCDWLASDVLKEEVGKVVVSNRLTSTPSALVASQFGWSGNMERIVSAQTHSKSDDPSRSYYLNQRKTLEINPRHPLIKALLQRVVEENVDDETRQTTRMLYYSTVLRSGFQLKDTTEFATSMENLMRKTMGVDLGVEVDEEEGVDEEPPTNTEEENAEGDHESGQHDEL